MLPIKRVGLILAVGSFLTSCASVIPPITDHHIFTVVTNTYFYSLAGTDQSGAGYRNRRLLMPVEQTFPQHCGAYDAQGYGIRTPDGTLALPDTDADGNYQKTFVYGDRTETWTAMLWEQEQLDSYLWSTYGFQITDITVHPLKLEGPINGYAAYEVTGEVTYNAYPSVVDDDCVLSVGSSVVTAPYELRFLDAGERWKVINQDGDIWSIPKAQVKPNTYTFKRKDD